MFRDRERELQRLEEQLMEEEELELEEEELLNEDEVDNLLEDADQTGDPEAYHNYSNGYGRIYNGDRVDVDVEQFSQEILSPEKKRGCTGFLVLLLLLMLAVLGTMVWTYLKMGGFV